ncbi:AMP-binding protein [Cupriavidus oxalaticus]|uniref:AMP-binding protein n=1 Tax=Cupriavidus oxalaticus TaxID=96344 RepID=UPI00317C6B71
MSSNSTPAVHLPAGDPSAARVSGCALFRRLEALAQAQPDTIAVGSATYRDLLDASLALAGYMQQRLGVRPGDHVLLMLEDGESSAIATYAVARCSATAIAPDAHEDGAEIARQTAAHGVQVAIAPTGALPALAPLLDDGSLYGCIVPGAVQYARPGVHDLAGAVAAGIAPVPLPAGHRSGDGCGYPDAAL